MKKKGRPKGSGQTVIGLPKKSSGRVNAFSKKSSSEKIKSNAIIAYYYALFIFIN